MRPPTQIFEDTELLAYVAVPKSARFTGRLHLYVDGERLGAVPFLAICKPCDEEGLLLIHCDSAWEPLGIQAWNGPDVEPIKSVGEMKTQAEMYYEGLLPHWVDVASGTA